jgi:hypothetical protein
MKRCLGTLLKSKTSFLTKLFALFILLEPMLQPVLLLFMFVLFPANLSKDFSEFWFLVPMFVFMIALHAVELGTSHMLFAFPVFGKFCVCVCVFFFQMALLHLFTWLSKQI